MTLAHIFERIGWTGPAPPTLATFCGVMAGHMTHIPFENLDVLLGRPPRLDVAGLQDKLVRAKRGGYCFEHMTLFSAALKAIGLRRWRIRRGSFGCLRSMIRPASTCS